MSPLKNDPEDRLDQVLARIRDDVPDAERTRGAGERVWRRLRAEAGEDPSPDTVETIHGCEDVRSLLRAHLRGALPPAKALLVEDHTRDCVACGKALRELRSGAPASPSRYGAPSASRRGPVLWWGVAAASLLVAALVGYGVYRNLPADPALAVVQVRAVDGALYRVSGNWSAAAIPGEEIPGGQVFRTARGSRAVVRLADGSEVELNERSELSVSAKRSGTTLHLSRGNIIVQAAPQRSKHLWVATADCRVAVTGTIFTVNHGTKGSRVSVIEGEVHVERAGNRDVLRPGDQVSTSPTLGPVSLATEIAWSQDVDRHLALVAELTRLRRDLEQIPSPPVRHDTRLLDLSPDGTVVYAAIPNVGTSLGEAHRIFRERLEGSPLLSEWWNTTMAPAGADAEVDEAIRTMRAFSEQLQDEIAFTLSSTGEGRFDGVLVLAPLARPAEFPAFLAEQVARLTTASQGAARLRIVSDLSAEPPSGGDRELLLWVHGDLLAASPSVAELRRLQSVLDGGTAGSFAGSPFRASLARSYDQGTSFLFGVDLERILAQQPAAAPSSDVLRRAGLLDARHLVVEGKETDGQTVYGAALSFDQPRRGIASWLAAPSPMGSLEFVSPEATLATAFATQDTAAMARELLAILSDSDPDFAAHLAEFQTRHGVDIVRDLAAPLGGEFAFALDGPILPTPSWKAVFEVYDTAKLQHAVEWAVGELNQLSVGSGTPALRVDREEVGDRTWYAVRSERLPFEVHYTFMDGYLVAAPSRGLVEAALGYRASGAALPESPRFTALLPRDGQANFSAVAYQNLAPLVGPVASAVGSSGSSSPKDVLAGLLADAPASLAYAYGEPDRIVAASTRPGGIFGSDLQMLLGLDGLLHASGELRPAAEGSPLP